MKDTGVIERYHRSVEVYEGLLTYWMSKGRPIFEPQQSIEFIAAQAANAACKLAHLRNNPPKGA